MRTNPYWKSDSPKSKIDTISRGTQNYWKLIWEYQEYSDRVAPIIAKDPESLNGYITGSLSFDDKNMRIITLKTLTDIIEALNERSD